MKINFVMGIVFLFVIVACEKSEKTNEYSDVKPFNVTSYFPLTTNSYWVYDLYQIDSIGGKETLESQNDTIMIIGDTTINSRTYAIFYGKTMLSRYKTEWYLRDSLNYIINNYGNIVFHIDFSNDTINKEPQSDWEENYIMMYILESYPDYITSNSHITNCVNYKLNITRNNTEKDYIGALSNIYVPHIGKTIKQLCYIHSFETTGQYFENRLKDYYIAE